ncbi:MAG: acetyl-CoA carboxylase carboxyltransferase subunit alpha [Nitrospirota bacterium]
MPPEYLDFERPVAELDRQLEEILAGPPEDREEARFKVAALRAESERVLESIMTGLTPWQRVQIARHPSRPSTLNYLQSIFSDVIELKGDRRFADDQALVCALARIDKQSVAVIGHQKGRTTREKIARNFGMPNPEGYRKSIRTMKLAEKFRLPVVTFIDTPGAYPGLEAEERGQAEAIAASLFEMSRLRVPVIVAVTGEGGSGGALAIGVGDRILMLEHAVYSVISPEGCAAILWKGDPASKVADATAALRMTAGDLLSFGVIDEVLKEPPGGAHRDPDRMAATLKEAIVRHLGELKTASPEDRVEARYQKFRRMGVFKEKKTAVSAPAKPRRKKSRDKD